MIRSGTNSLTTNGQSAAASFDEPRSCRDAHHAYVDGQCEVAAVCSQFVLVDRRDREVQVEAARPHNRLRSLERGL